MVDYIYCLKCPDTDKVMYIGKTNNPKRRLYQHVSDVNKTCGKKDRWIKSLLDEGKRPVMSILEESDDWDRDEKKWINLYGGTKKLLNISSGGRIHSFYEGKKEKSLHLSVINRFTSYARDTGNKSFKEYANAYRKLRREMEKRGLLEEYNKFLEVRFLGVFSVR